MVLTSNFFSLIKFSTFSLVKLCPWWPKTAPSFLSEGSLKLYKLGPVFFLGVEILVDDGLEELVLFFF